MIISQICQIKKNNTLLELTALSSFLNETCHLLHELCLRIDQHRVELYLDLFEHL